MVSVFVGSGSGFARGSGSILGGAGLLGSGTQGRSGETVSVNAATGNLLITQQDDFLIGRGPDVGISRTYNSLAQMSDGDNGDQWQQSTLRRVFGLTGTLNTAGSMVSRQSGDGSVIAYTWNAAQSAYVATDGDGAHDRLARSGATWVWTDGSSQTTETYETSIADAALFRIRELADSDGNKLAFTYVAGTDKLDRVTTANHGTVNAATGVAEQSYVQYIWSGNNISEIVTGYTDYGASSTEADNVNRTLTRTRYAYDGSHRLITVTVDLSPDDNDIADGKTYVTSYTYDGSSKRVANITQTDGSSLAVVYDSSNRVSSFSQAVEGGVLRTTTLTYGADYTLVTDPTGQTTRLDFESAAAVTGIDAWLVDGAGSITREPATIGGASATKLTQHPGSDAKVYYTGTVGPGETATLDVILQAVDSATTQNLGILGQNSHGGTEYQSWARIVSGPGQIEYTGTGEWTVTGLSTSEGTRVQIMRAFAGDDTYTASLAVGVSGSTSGGSVIVAAATVFKGSAGNIEPMDPAQWTEMSGWNGVVEGVLGQVSHYPGTRQYTLLSEGALSGVASPAFSAAAGETISFFTYLKAGDADTSVTISFDHPYGTTRARIVSGPGTLTLEDYGVARIIGLDDAIATLIEVTITVTEDPFGFPFTDLTPTLFFDDSMDFRAGATVTVDTPYLVKWPEPPLSPPPPANSIRLTRITAPPASAGTAEQVLQFGYDADDNLTSVTDAAGKVSNYTYDGQGNLLTSTDPNGHVVTRTYGSKNELLTETRTGADASGANVSHTIRYVYDGENHLRYAISAEGHVTEYRYTPAGQLQVELAYPEQGYPAGSAAPGEATMDSWRDSITDKQSVKTTTYYYDTRGNLANVIKYGYADAVGGGVTSEGYTHSFRTYDQAGRLLARHTAPQSGETFVYDGLGRLIGSTDMAGGTTTIVFNDAALTTTVTTAAGGTTVSSYNKAGDLVGTAYSGSHDVSGSTSYQYDKDGRLRVATDATGYKSYYLYDKSGRKIADINHDGQVVEYRYDAGNRVSATARYAQALSTSQRSALEDPDNLLEMADIRPAPHAYDIWSWSIYDDAGRLIQSIDGDGGVAAFSYDASNRLVKTTGYYNKLSAAQLTAFRTASPTAPTLPAADSRDAVSRSFYDRDGRLIGALDGEGYLSEIVYDKAGQKVEEVFYAAKASSTYWTAGSFNELRSSAAPGSGTNRRAHYVYDGQGFLRFSIDNAGYVTEYIYKSEVDWGAIGLVRSTIRHAVAISTNDFTYDNVKALVGANASHAANRASWSVYDAAGRLAYAIGTDGAVTSFTYDIMGNVIKTVAFAAKRATPFLPTHADMDVWRDTNAIPSADRVTRNWYTASGDLRFTVDAEGYIRCFNRDAEGRVVSEYLWNTAFSVADNVSADYLYGLISADDTYVATWYSRDSLGRVVSERLADRNGHGPLTVYDYYPNGLLANVWQAYGSDDQSLSTRVYDGAGRLRLQYEARGEPEQTETHYSYDGLGNRTSVTDARGKVTTFTYDERGQVLSMTDAAGGVTSYEYNAFGEVVKTTDPKGAVTYSYYDAMGRLTYSVDAEQYVTRSYYDGFGEMTRLVRYATTFSASAATTLSDLDTAFGASSAAPPATAAVTTFEYDKRGLVTRTTDAEGFFETYAYNAFGNRTRITNKLGGTTDNTYDGNGRLRYEWVDTKVYDNAGNITSDGFYKNIYEYDARGNILLQVEAYGLPERRDTSFVYDRANRLIETIGQTFLGMTPHEYFAYDARGNMTSRTDAAGARTLYYYDDLGRVTVTIDALGFYTAHAYDANGNILSTRVYETSYGVPADGGAKTEAPPPPGTVYRETVFTYDNLNRLTSSSVAGAITGHWTGSGWTSSTAAIVTRFEYDALGNVVKTVDANGNASFSYYDRLGRKTHQVDAANYLTFWTYDAEGNALTEKRYSVPVAAPIGTVTPPALPAGDGALRETVFTYDRNGNRLSEARSGVRVHNGSGNTTEVTATLRWRYNGLGQVVQKDEATDDLASLRGQIGDESIYYRYDTGGRLIQEERAAFAGHQNVIVTPTVDYFYNGLGNLTRTVAAGAGDTAERVTAYTYDGGKLRTVSDALGFIRAYLYDIAGRVTHDYYARLGSDGTAAFDYDGSLTAYDALGRAALQWQANHISGTGWVHNGPRTATAYNAYGEVLSVATDGIPQQQNRYDAGGRLIATSAGDGVWKHFGYDANGNQTIAITSAGANLAGLSFADALALVGQENVNATYTVYDARNMATSVTEEQRRLSSGSVQNLTSSRSYNAFGEVISETSALGATTTYSYNNIGRMIRSEGPAVQMTRENGGALWIRAAQDFYYDASGRLVATRDANGDYADNSGNSQGNPASKAAHTGALTRLTLLAGTGYNGSEALVTAQTAADGGVRTTKYDIHGDARILIDELGRTTSQIFDKMGRVTQVSHAGGLIDSYAYDGLGQRIKHWNNVPALYGDVETTDYDTQGRVTKTRAFGGDVTTTSYAWDASITSMPGITSGGWTQVTTMANGRTLTEKTDIFGRTTWKQDLGGHVTTFAYDIAGRQTGNSMGGLTTTFTYFNTGQIATNSGPAGTATYGYDAAGNRLSENLVSGGVTIKSQSATYDAQGRLKTWAEAGTTKSPAASTTHDYDANGNIRRTQSSFAHLDATGNASPYPSSSDTWYRFDSMNRLVTDKGTLSGTAGAAGTVIVRGYNGDNMTQWGRDIVYDVAGQRIGVLTSRYEPGQWERVGGTGGGLEEPIDQEDEFVYVPGLFREHRENYTYDVAGRLTEVRNAYGAMIQESYTPTGGGTGTPDSPVPAAPATGGFLRGSFTYDLMGRLTLQQDYGSAGGGPGMFTGVIYSRELAYNAKGQVTSDDVSTAKSRYGALGWDTFRSVTSYDYGSGSAYALGSVVSQTATNSKSASGGSWSSQPGTLTTTTYAWYDGAVQDLVTHDYDTGSGSNPLYTTDLLLNGFGQMTGATVTDGVAKNVAYTLDETGQIIRRDESRTGNPSQAAPHEVYYRFGGRQMGMTGNNGATNLGYIASTEARSGARPDVTASNAGLFRNGTSTSPGAYADFATSYDAYNSDYQGSAGGLYTVRQGDTLQGIAAALWGDANLWYKLAEANGIGANNALFEGQTLVLPTGVSRSGHSASSVRPYDPAEAIGDLSPTTPKPPKKPKCGMFGQILVAAIAIGLSAWLGPQFIGIAQGLLGSAFAGAVVGGAAAGALSSAVSQGFGVATGIQNGFSWKGVGMAAIAGGIGGGISALGKAAGAAGNVTDKITNISKAASNSIGAAVTRGVASSILTQGIGRITGLQSRFDFAGVAAAGIGAGFSNFVSSRTTSLGDFGSETLANTAGGIANAATRSAINGNSFGDNLRAALPDIIGQTLGNLVAGSAASGKTGNAAKNNPTSKNAAAIDTTAEAVALAITGSAASVTTSGMSGHTAAGGGAAAVYAESADQASLIWRGDADPLDTHRPFSQQDPVTGEIVVTWHRDRSAPGKTLNAKEYHLIFGTDGPEPSFLDRQQSLLLPYSYRHGWSALSNGPTLSAGEPYSVGGGYRTNVTNLQIGPSSQISRGSNQWASGSYVYGGGNLAFGKLSYYSSYLTGGVATALSLSREGTPYANPRDIQDAPMAEAVLSGVGGMRVAASRTGTAGAAAARAAESAVPNGKFYSVAFETKLNPTSYPGVSRGRHFQESNEAFLKAMEGDAAFAKSMRDMGIDLQRTPKGLAPRTSPDNWTWHHDQGPGVMQLVPRTQHQPGSIFQDAFHPNGKGGYSIWGK